MDDIKIIEEKENEIIKEIETIKKNENKIFIDSGIIKNFQFTRKDLYGFEEDMLRIYAILNILNNPLETYKETYLTEIKQILIELYNQRSEIYIKNIYGPLNYTFNVSYSVPNWDLICQIVRFLEKNCR